MSTLFQNFSAKLKGFFFSQLGAGYNLQGLATSEDCNSKTCFLVAIKRALKCTEQGASVFTVR